MRVMTCSESRDNYAETLLDEYESLKHAAYPLHSPENARRLRASIDRLEAGEGTTRDLIE
jgi:antitoxin YefM